MSRVLKRVTNSPSQTTEIPKFDIQALRAREEMAASRSESKNFSENVSAEVLLDEAREMANQLVQKAEEQREAIFDNARKEAERLHKEAYELGYQEGFSAGEETARVEGQARFEELIELAQSIADDNKRRWEEIVQSLHTVASAVVTKAVKVLVQRELEVAPADIDSMVSHLLEYVVEGARVRVLVNPMDYERAAHEFGQWVSDGYGEWPITVVPDASLSPGGCVLETAHGQVDAKMETRMELVQSALARVMERGIADELGE
ncbi:FliH/SctL family protein [Alicyclobacillus sp. SO9]|uniref:FliH/SctL family protein n=1 Tax=Alicyclobacillus sp. SO9 TaxID=2665646 RepID=UPI0018E8E74C|nr:FliH/SctL family protein [Alicyclobacillus sp. SO9]QQE80804.1 hypothetical protein GI364_10715 [Alicyclobacillus sp. SO9]